MTDTITGYQQLTSNKFLTGICRRENGVRYFQNTGVTDGFSPREGDNYEIAPYCRDVVERVGLVGLTMKPCDAIILEKLRSQINNWQIKFVNNVTYLTLCGATPSVLLSFEKEQLPSLKNNLHSGFGYRITYWYIGLDSVLYVILRRHHRNQYHYITVPLEGGTMYSNPVFVRGEPLSINSVVMCLARQTLTQSKWIKRVTFFVAPQIEGVHD